MLLNIFSCWKNSRQIDSVFTCLLLAVACEPIRLSLSGWSRYRVKYSIAAIRFIAIFTLLSLALAGCGDMNFDWDDKTETAHICFTWEFPENCSVETTVYDAENRLIAEGLWPSIDGYAVLYNVPAGPDNTIIVLGQSDQNTVYRFERSSVYLVQDVCTDVNVVDPVYFSPELLVPDDGEILTGNRLEWGAVDGADMYLIEIAEESDFSDLVTADSISSTYFEPSNLMPSSTYYWRVIAIDAMGNEGVVSDFQAFETPSTDAGLVAYYPFSGTPEDHSGQFNHGTIVNEVTLTPDRFGNPDEAYAFGGSDDYISVPHDASLDAATHMTIAAWIRPTITHGRYILKKNGAFSLDIYPGKARALFSRQGYISTDFSIEGNSEIVEDEWQHIAASCDENVLKIYYNGHLEKAVSTGGGIKTSSNPLLIGRYSGTSFNGAIDEIRVYRRTLSENEIIALYLQTDPVN